MAEDAVVAVYAEAPLCPGAERVLAQEIARSGPEVRLVCMDAVDDGGRIDLARVGANARAATEDSTAVAYLAAPDSRAIRFTRPILDAAEIPLLRSDSATAAMSRVLEALATAPEDGSLRQAVADRL